MHNSKKYKITNLEYGKKNNPSLKSRDIKIGIFNLEKILIAGPFSTYSEAFNLTGISLSSLATYIKSGKKYKYAYYIKTFTPEKKVDKTINIIPDIKNNIKIIKK
jgi:hypothetical protein